MKDRLPRRRRARASTWFMSGLVIACLLSLGLILVGCGGESSGADTTAATVSGVTTATTAEATEMSGTELGDAVGATWVEATQKLNTLLEGQPEVSAVQSQVEALKEEYIQKLVAFGEQRQALDTAGRAQADSATAQALNAAASADWYTAYMTNYEAYSYASGDVEFTNLLAGFNILTQYADFDLLKQQAPDEAARLGIE